MKLRPVIGTTKYGSPFVSIYDGAEDNKLLVKVYFSPDETKIRIMLPELANFAQTKIDPDYQMINFERNAVVAQQKVRQ